MRIAKIGIIGTGHISEIYCENLTTVHENTEIVAVADVNRAAAEAKAAKWNIPYVLTVDELLKREDIDIVVNLTPPKNHYEIIKASLLAGKHVFTEKPLATTAAEADELIALAEETGKMLGAAPETNYGASVSTAKACSSLKSKGGRSPARPCSRPYFSISSLATSPFSSKAVT